MIITELSFTIGESVSHCVDNELNLKVYRDCIIVISRSLNTMATREPLMHSVSVWRILNILKCVFMPCVIIVWQSERVHFGNIEFYLCRFNCDVAFCWMDLITQSCRLSLHHQLECMGKRGEPSSNICLALCPMFTLVRVLPTSQLSSISSQAII